MTAVAEHSVITNIKSVAPEQLEGDLIQPDHSLFGLIWINPERLGGTPCFYGSRVPIKNLFDYLESGHSLGEFLDDFDGITREQVVGVLELSRRGLLAELPRT